MQEMLKQDILVLDKTRVDSSLIKGKIKPRHGTTTAAFVFCEGMVIAVDSRATSGSYIASQTVNKVIEINKYMLGTMAGGAADCFYWERYMGTHAKMFELLYGRRISVSAASMYLSRCLRQYKGYGLSVGSMICGWDRENPGLYYVDNDGTRIKGSLFSVGSGSTIAYSVLSSYYRYDMSKNEALDLGRRAIYHAAHRDAFSGGTVNLYFMDKDGWTKIGSYDIAELHEKYNKD
eukprot:jgi/Antlo1/2113/2310